MHRTLFSDILLADPLRTAPPTLGRTAGHEAAQRNTRAFAEALTGALADLLPPDVELLLPDPGDVDALATIMAEVVMGQSVVMRLRPTVDEAARIAIRTFLQKLLRVTESLDANRHEAAIAKLADVILPDDLGEARGALAADNLDLRDRFVAQTSSLTSADIAARAGYKGINPYATAARWKKAGDIFSVNHRGAEYFPAFQFREGRPHPTIKAVLNALPLSLTPWQRALWFVSTNGWLADKSPSDCLDRPDAVVAAAQREGIEVAG